MRSWDGDMFEDYLECVECHVTIVTGTLCHTCQDEAEYLDSLDYETKADRRSVRREKGRYGPIRHLPGDFRPPKIRVRVR